MATVNGLVKFDITGSGSVEAGKYIRKGKIFQAGDYKEKSYAMTADELKSFADKFNGKKRAPVKVEHVPSFFDGKLGDVSEVWVEGDSLFGKVEFPQWMEEVAKDEPITVSCGWDTVTKDLKEVSLAVNPHITDAVLFAAFSHEIDTVIAAEESENPFQTEVGRAIFALVPALFAKKKTYEGQSVLQSIHDQTARAGAVCAGSESAKFHTRAELNAIQEIHDRVVKGGAKCSDMSGKPSYGFFSKLFESDQTDEEGDISIMALSEKEESAMVAFFKKHFPKIFGDGASDDPTKSGDPNAKPNAPTGSAAQFNNDPNLLAQFKELRESRMDAEIKSLIAEGRIAPKMKEAVKADFNEMAELDDESPKIVTFSVIEEGKDGKKQVEKKGSRLDRRIAYYHALPKHRLTEERIRDDEDVTVLESDEGNFSAGQFNDDEIEKQAERIAGRHNRDVSTGQQARNNATRTGERNRGGWIN